MEKQLNYIDNILTICVGGNSLYPRHSSSFDFTFFNNLSKYIEYQKQHYKTIILVPGGFGGQFFFEQSRQVGCSELELNIIGSKLIEVASIILCRYMKDTCMGKVINCSDYKTLFSIVTEFDIIIAGFTITGSITSDSLAALIASHVKSDLVYIKNYHSKPEVGKLLLNNDDMTISIQEIIKYATQTNYFGKAGNAPVDYKMFELIKLTGIYTRIMLTSDILQNKFRTVDHYTLTA
jgi:uridylate kinase